MDPSTLSLFPATPEQVEASRRQTWPMWGKDMPLDEYLKRDRELEKLNKFTVWVLAPRKGPSTLDFLCSCVTLRRSGLIARGTSDKPIVEEVECYGIAAVFTPVENRGKGYAHLMMSLLHWVVAGDVLPPDSFPTKVWGPRPVSPPGMGKAVFSTLWSGVGDFYRTCSPDDAEHANKNGWVVRGARTSKWFPMKGVDKEDEGDLRQNLGGWRWLNENEVNQLSVHDAMKMKDSLGNIWSASSPETKVIFTLQPSDGVEAFQRAMHKPFWMKEGIDRWGLALMPVDNDLSTSQAYVSWILVLRPPSPRTLIITRLHVEHVSELGEIFRRLWRYSLDYNVEVVEVWNFPLHLREGFECARGWFGEIEGKEEFEREDNLPAFKWYGFGSESALNSDLGESEIEWAYNEKFCAC